MDEQPKILLAGEGTFEKSRGIKHILKMIKEGKVIVISGSVEFLDEPQTEEFRGVGKTLSSFSAQVESMKDSLAELIEAMKLTEYKAFDYYPFDPIEHNYRPSNLNYNFMRDKRKYRAPINRR